jgi:hypothetical protein
LNYATVLLPLLFGLENWYLETSGIVQFTPDLMHPDQEGDFEAQAYQTYADMA